MDKKQSTMILVLLLALGVLGFAQDRTIDWLSPARWRTMDERDKTMFTIGYATGMQSWELVIARAQLSEWPLFRERLKWPAYIDIWDMITHMDDYYSAGGQSPFSVEVLNMRPAGQ